MRRWVHFDFPSAALANAVLANAVLANAALPTALLLSAIASGCGSSPPREADIFHDPALRPGVVEAQGAEREMLARLGSIPDETQVEAAGTTLVVEAPYAAASGRRCRGLRAVSGRRIACETSDGEWVFVPDVSGAEAPVAVPRGEPPTQEAEPSVPVEGAAP